MNLFIPGQFTTLNEYIRAERGNRYAAATIKRAETDRVAVEAINCAPIVRYPVNVVITWYRKDQKSDPDNVAFATKFILDGLMQAGALAGDGWKHIGQITHHFEIDRTSPGVEIQIS